MPLDALASEYGARLREVLGPHLRGVVLFGSRARGDARPGSDYDVLVLVDRRTPELSEAALGVSVEMLDRHGELFAAVVRSEREWAEVQGFPLAMNIAREGVAL